MRQYCQRFLESLAPGVRVLLVVWVAAWLADLLARWFHTFDLHQWICLSGPLFWHGGIWRLVTYALLPEGIGDLVTSALALVIVGGMLERQWTRGQLWAYCLVTAIGGGLARLLVQGIDPMPLSGAMPVILGLLVAWGFLAGRELVMVPLLGETTVWKLVLIAGAISVLVAFFTAGLAIALIMLAGGLTGFLYLWLKHQWLMNRPGHVVHSERIHRLEL